MKITILIIITNLRHSFLEIRVNLAEHNFSESINTSIIFVFWFIHRIWIESTWANDIISSDCFVIILTIFFILHPLSCWRIAWRTIFFLLIFLISKFLVLFMNIFRLSCNSLDNICLLWNIGYISVFQRKGFFSETDNFLLRLTLFWRMGYYAIFKVLYLFGR